jgi:pyruvate dehydrogenase E2 component (dihydrolipoamide acetyltransferase)
MPINILMPALSPTMEKGNLAKWLKKEGDAVKSGDVIAEIETDKATMEVEAVDEGTLAKILVPEGTADVPVNQVIAVLAGEGEDVKTAAGSAARATSPGAAPSKAAAAPQTAAGSFETRPAGAPQDEGKKEAAPLIRHPRPEEAPTGPREARPDDGLRAVSKDAGPSASTGSRIFSSPLARRLAKESGIELARVQGSGPRGRVVARDIEAAQAGRGLKAPGAAPAAPPVAAPLAIPTPSDSQVRALFEDGSYEVVPHDNIRKIIAQRLTQAKLTIPHFYLTVDCDIGRLLAAREEINASAPKDKDGKGAYKLSVNDFVIKALALALQRVPDANVTWTDGGMLKHRHSDVGVAVAIPGGLITPVVRKAETKSLSAISAEMKDYAARARARKLKPEEYQGGTTAVSNLGMYGIKDFAAVINPPHATILAVGAGEERAVVREGKVVPAWIMSCTLSTDHRAVDGALGSELIGAFKALIENPVMMVV